MIKIRFCPEDLALFARASHDRNPAHISAAYARRTAYGQPVVFGVLGLLACLQHMQKRPASLLKISCEFLQPLFTDLDYTLAVDAQTDNQTTARLYDGSMRLLKATAVWQDPISTDPPTTMPASPQRQTPRHWQPADFTPSLALSGTYAPNADALALLLNRFDLELPATQIDALLWASYFTGMELPGQHALFAYLALQFEACPPSGPLQYDARLRSFDKRFSLLKTEGNLSSGNASFATAQLRAFFQPPAPMTSDNQLRAQWPPSHQFAGKTAFITGASRGLGAAVCRMLAWQGCTVYANFRQSLPEAEALQLGLQEAPGEVVLVPGDAGDPAIYQAKEILAIDYLICNASPSLRPLLLHADTLERFHGFVQQSLALVASPVATCLPTVAQRGGWLVIVSSAALSDPPADWPHYVAAKQAIEGLAYTAVRQHRQLSALILRPPRLLTDFTNSPLGRNTALDPIVVAGTLQQRLRETPCPGQVEIIDTFLEK